jgi:hypothetical protein
MNIRQAIAQYLEGKRVFIGPAQGTSIKEVPTDDLIDDLTTIITDVNTANLARSFSFRGEAERGPRRQVAPEFDKAAEEAKWKKAAEAYEDGPDPDGEWDHLDGDGDGGSGRHGPGSGTAEMGYW